MLCVSTLAISHIFYVAADSNPDSVSSPFGLNGEVCPVDASVAVWLSHLETLDLFLRVSRVELHELCRHRHRWLVNLRQKQQQQQ